MESIEQNKNKKIIYAITKSNWGGAQKYVYENALKDKESGTEVIVILGGNGVLKDKLNEADINTIEMVSLMRNINPLLDIKSLIKLTKIFRVESPNIVHLNSSKIGGLGALAGRISNLFKTKEKKTKILFTAHGWAFNENRFFLSKILIRIASYITLILSHKTYVLSKFEYNQFKNWPFVKNKIEIINLHIGNVEFIDKNESRKLISKQISIDISNKKWIGTIAELHKNKGLQYGVEAMKNVSNEFIWIIIGSGEERESIQKQIDQNNLSHRIFLLGEINEAARLLKAFDIFILPSIKEGLPYVILEAHTAGIPIITTTVGGIPEYFQKHNLPPNKYQIISPAKANELTSAINRI